jgi:hypothetical protein
MRFVRLNQFVDVPPQDALFSFKSFGAIQGSCYRIVLAREATDYEIRSGNLIAISTHVPVHETREVFVGVTIRTEVANITI